MVSLIEMKDKQRIRFSEFLLLLLNCCAGDPEEKDEFGLVFPLWRWIMVSDPA